jgi:hypothetical protein
MNPKQAAPLIATLPALAVIAPPIIIGGAIGLAIAFVLKKLLADTKQKQPSEAASVEASKESWKPAETTAFRQIPVEIPAAKPVPVLLASALPAVVPQPAVQLVPKASVPVRAPQKIVGQSPPSVKRKFVAREDMANVFQSGRRTLTRTAAVTVLKGLGFGKTAAYAALTSDGRFAAWLKYASDGIITWTDGHGT